MTKATNPTSGDERFCRLPEILNRVAFSRAELYRRMASGDFPRPIALGKRARAWKKTDIDAYIELLAGRKA